MGESRRAALLSYLRGSARPVTGNELAARLGASRQVIVQDVALLRARGEELIATPLGYVLAERLTAPSTRAVFACRHSREATEDELTVLVDLGVRVRDVIVEHPLYGEIRGLLELSSRADVSHFVERMRQSDAPLLSALTKGVHLHTVEAHRAGILDAARRALRERGYLLEESDDGADGIIGSGGTGPLG